jgi:hypothetical protein
MSKSIIVHHVQPLKNLVSDFLRLDFRQWWLSVEERIQIAGFEIFHSDK